MLPRGFGAYFEVARVGKFRNYRIFDSLVQDWAETQRNEALKPIFFDVLAQTANGFPKFCQGKFVIDGA